MTEVPNVTTKQHDSYDDFIAKFPEGADAAGVRLDPRMHPDDLAALALPSAAHMAMAQEDSAVDRIAYTPDVATHWRLPELQRVLGPMVPGDMIVGAARTGSGKTLFFTNLLDDLVEQDRCVLYLGTEQDADVLVTKWACARIGVHPRLILAPEQHEVGTPERAQAVRDVTGEVMTLRSGKYRDLAIFPPNARRLDQPTLRKWVRGGVQRYGIEFVIVDHLDRLGDAKNPWVEQANMIVTLKELAVEFGIVALGSSQCKPQPDVMARLSPPQLTDFAGMASKTNEADVAFSIYRPIAPGVDKDTFKALREGRIEMRSLWMPNTMGVECLKHRLDESRLHASCLLDVRGARLEARPTHTKWMP